MEQKIKPRHVAPSPDVEPRLPASFILKLQDDLDASRRLLAELPQIIAQKEKKLEAAMQFAPDGFNPADRAAKDAANAQLFPELGLSVLQESPVTTNPTWIGETARILNEQKSGISHQDLLSMLKKTKLSPSTGDKGFYNAIAKLSEKGELRKHGNLLYSKKLVEEMKSRGEPMPELSEGVTFRQNGSASMVMGVLGDHPRGLSGTELRKIVGLIPDAPKSLGKHSQYIYNVLGTLMGSGTVKKKDGKYVLAIKQAPRKSNVAH